MSQKIDLSVSNEFSGVRIDKFWLKISIFNKKYDIKAYRKRQCVCV